MLRRNIILTHLCSNVFRIFHLLWLLFIYHYVCLSIKSFWRSIFELFIINSYLRKSQAIFVLEYLTIYHKKKSFIDQAIHFIHQCMFVSSSFFEILEN